MKIKIMNPRETAYELVNAVDLEWYIQEVEKNE